MTYCDSWLDAPYVPVVETFHASGRPALMCVFRNENRWDASNVHFENGVIRRYSKKLGLPEMQHIDWGLAMLKASAVAIRPTGTPWDLAELYEELSTSGDLAGYEMTHRFTKSAPSRDLSKQTDLCAWVNCVSGPIVISRCEGGEIGLWRPRDGSS